MSEVEPCGILQDLCQYSHRLQHDLRYYSHDHCDNDESNDYEYRRLYGSGIDGIKNIVLIHCDYEDVVGYRLDIICRIFHSTLVFVLYHPGLRYGA